MNFVLVCNLVTLAAIAISVWELFATMKLLSRRIDLLESKLAHTKWMVCPAKGPAQCTSGWLHDVRGSVWYHLPR